MTIEDKTRIQILHLINDGKNLASTIPTMKQRKEMIRQARKKAIGFGIVDTATREIGKGVGGELFAGAAKFIGLNARAGRRVGSVAGSNLAIRARDNRIALAENDAASQYDSMCKLWQDKASTWLNSTIILISTIYQNYSKLPATPQNLSTKFRKQYGHMLLNTQIRRALLLLENLYNFPETYLEEKELRVRMTIQKTKNSIFIKQGHYASGFVKLEEIAYRAKNELLWQDPYLSIDHMLILKNAPQKCQIRLLVGGSTSSSEILSMLRTLKIQGRKIEVRWLKPTGSAPPFHDRFLLTDNESWHVGTSAGGIGIRDCAMTAINDSHEIRKRFEELWRMAEGNEI